MTQWRVINRLRAIAEHGGLRPGPTVGSPPTTCARAGSPGSGWSRTTRAGTWPTTWTWVSRGGSCPRFHAELERAGYVTEGITYPNYLALWRALASA